MAAAIDRLLSLNPKVSHFSSCAEISCQEQKLGFGDGSLRFERLSLSSFRRSAPSEISGRFSTRISAEASTTLDPASTSSSFEDFTVTSSIKANGDIKLKINVSGSKTQIIFDDVFSKLVAAAQPIPGFRRLKGGKTGDIPKDILMHILGPSKIYKQSIKKIINTTVAEYVAKESLKVTKDLKVDETLEELEAVFEAGKPFEFNAALLLLEVDDQNP